MLKFYITPGERKHAQKRAAELDVSHSNPPGQHPYVWENWIGCAKRWYDSASAEGKIGTIWFKPVLEKDARLSGMVECTTKITHRPLVPERKVRRVRITEPQEHKKLVECFILELLDSAPKDQEGELPVESHPSKRARW